MDEKEKAEKLKEIIQHGENIVFFGGAGVSTESGIPDFRGSSGLYSKKFHNISPEEILSNTFLYNHPKEFYEYYFNNMIYTDSKPNDAHKVLAALEKAGELRAVITQNIDGLHQKAGSKNVIELHGSSLRNYCVRCGRRYDLNFILKAKEKGFDYPVCTACGSLVRPDVVMYGEALNESEFKRARDEISRADVFIVGGTSLTVFPASYLIHFFTGGHLAIINKTPTPYDAMAQIIIRGSIGKALKEAADF